MFGLENQKKSQKKIDEFVFDLEKDFKDSKKHREIKAKIEDRIQLVKDVLRTGENKEDFDKFGTLLHGYTSLLKVMSRFTATK